MSASAVANRLTSNMQQPSAPTPPGSQVVAGPAAADQRDQMWSELQAICERLRPPVCPQKPFNAYSVLKQLQNDYFPRIVESKHWSHVLLHYRMLARAYSHLRDDLMYQGSGILLLAHFINHNCDELLRTAAPNVDPDPQDVLRRFDRVWDEMHTILGGSVEHKVLVMLRTRMCEQNAFFLVLLYKRIYEDIVKRVGQEHADRRQSAIVLLNGVVLLLTRWYRMQRTEADRQKFHEDMEPLVKRLEKMRSDKQLLANGVRFYEQFGEDYRTAEIAALYTKNINHAVIPSFFQAYVTYWRSRTPALLAAEKLRKASLLDNGVVEIDDDQDERSAALIILDDDDDTSASIASIAPPALFSNTTVVVLSDSEDEDTTSPVTGAKDSSAPSTCAVTATSSPILAPPSATPATPATPSTTPTIPATPSTTPATTEDTPATKSAALEQLTSRLSIACLTPSTTADPTRTMPAISTALETPTATAAIMPATISATPVTTPSAPSKLLAAHESTATTQVLIKTATCATRERKTSTPNITSAAKTAEIRDSTPASSFKLHLNPVQIIMQSSESSTSAQPSTNDVFDSALEVATAEPIKSRVQRESVPPTSVSNPSLVHGTASPTTTESGDIYSVASTSTVGYNPISDAGAASVKSSKNAIDDSVVDATALTDASTVLKTAPTDPTTDKSSDSVSNGNVVNVVHNAAMVLETATAESTTSVSSDANATVLHNSTAVLETTSKDSSVMDSISSDATVTTVLDEAFTQLTTKESNEMVSVINDEAATFATNETVVHKSPTTQPTTSVSSDNVDLACDANIVTSSTLVHEKITTEHTTESSEMQSVGKDTAVAVMLVETPVLEAAIVQTATKESSEMVSIADDEASTVVTYTITVLAAATAQSTTPVSSDINESGSVATIVSSFNPAVDGIKAEPTSESSYLDSIANDEAETVMTNVTAVFEADIIPPTSKKPSEVVSVSDKATTVVHNVSAVYKTATNQPKTFDAIDAKSVSNSTVGLQAVTVQPSTSDSVVTMSTLTGMSNATHDLQGSTGQPRKISADIASSDRAGKLAATGPANKGLYVQKSMTVISELVNTFSENLVGATPKVINESSAPSTPVNVTAHSNSSKRAKPNAKLDIITKARAKSNVESSITVQTPTSIRKTRSKSSRSALPSTKRSSQVVQTAKCNKTYAVAQRDRLSPTPISHEVIDKFDSTSSNDSDSALAFPASRSTLASNPTESSTSTTFRAETITPPTPAVPKSLIIINPTDTVAVAQLTKSPTSAAFKLTPATVGIETTMCDNDSSCGETSIISDSHPSESSSSSSIYSAESVTPSIPETSIITKLNSPKTTSKPTPKQKSATASGDEDMVDNESQSSSCDYWSSNSLYGDENSETTSTSMPETPFETPEPTAAAAPVAHDEAHLTTSERSTTETTTLASNISGSSENHSRNLDSGPSEIEIEATKTCSALNSTDSSTTNASAASATSESREVFVPLISITVPSEISKEIPVSELSATIRLNIDDAEMLNAQIHLLSEAEQPLSRMFVRDSRNSKTAGVNNRNTMSTSSSVSSSSSAVPYPTKLVKNPVASTLTIQRNNMQQHPQARTHATTQIITNSAANATSSSVMNSHNPASIIMPVRLLTTAHPDFQRLPSFSQLSTPTASSVIVSSEHTTMDALTSVGETMSPCSADLVLSAGSSPASSVTSWFSTSASSSASSSSSSSFSSSSSSSQSPLSSTIDDTLSLQPACPLVAQSLPVLPHETLRHSVARLVPDAMIESQSKRPKVLETTSNSNPAVPVAASKKSSKRKRKVTSRTTSNSAASKLQITDVTSTTQSDSLPSPEVPMPPTVAANIVAAADSSVFGLQQTQQTDQSIAATMTEASSSSSTLNYAPVDGSSAFNATAPENYNSNSSGRCGTPLIDEQPSTMSTVQTEFVHVMPHKPTAIYGRVQTLSKHSIPTMPMHNGFGGLSLNTPPMQVFVSVGNQQQPTNVVVPVPIKLQPQLLPPPANNIDIDAICQSVLTFSNELRNRPNSKRKHLDTCIDHSMIAHSKKYRSNVWADEINLFTTHFNVLPRTRNRILDILTDSVQKKASSPTLQKLIVAEIFFVQSVMHEFRSEVPNPVNDLDELLRRSDESNYGWDTLTTTLSLYNKMKISYSDKHSVVNNILNHTDMFLKRWKEIRRSMFRMDGQSDRLAGIGCHGAINNAHSNNGGGSRLAGMNCHGTSNNNAHANNGCGRLTGMHCHGASNNAHTNSSGGMQSDLVGGYTTDDMNFNYVQDPHHLQQRLPLVEYDNPFDSLESYSDMLNTVKLNAHALVERSQEL